MRKSATTFRWNHTRSKGKNFGLLSLIFPTKFWWTIFNSSNSWLTRIQVRTSPDIIDFGKQSVKCLHSKIWSFGHHSQRKKLLTLKVTLLRRDLPTTKQKLGNFSQRHATQTLETAHVYLFRGELFQHSPCDPNTFDTNFFLIPIL